MRKDLIVSGIVALIAGLMFAFVLLNLIAETPQALYEDYDNINGRFKSYNEGSKIILYGKITYKKEYNETGQEAPTYRYVLNGRTVGRENYTFRSPKDIKFNKGDKVIVTCKIRFEGFKGDPDYFQYLSCEDVNQDPNVFIIPGYIFIVVGLLLAVLGVFLKSKEVKKSGKKKAKEGKGIGTPRPPTIPPGMVPRPPPLHTPGGPSPTARPGVATRIGPVQRIERPSTSISTSTTLMPPGQPSQPSWGSQPHPHARPPGPPLYPPGQNNVYDITVEPPTAGGVRGASDPTAQKVRYRN